MSYYIEILAVQTPFPLYQLDSQRRVTFSCNFNCRAVYPVASFEREMAKLITNASLATLEVNLFFGPQVQIPDSDGPIILLRNTGGRSADWSHDSAYENLSLQTLILGADYDVVGAKAKAIYQLLNGLSSVTVTV